MKKVKLSAKEAMRREAARRERELFEAWQRLPPCERTHFLRKRLPCGGSSL